MSGEILYQAPAVATNGFKAFVTRGGQVWNGSNLVATTAAAKALGAIALTRQGTTLDYLADFPVGIAAPGRYTVSVVDVSAPTGTEPALGSGTIDWTGSAEDTPNTASVQAALATIAGYVDTEVAAIKTKTDALPVDTTAALSAINTLAAAVKTKTDALPADTAAALTGLNTLSVAMKTITDKLGTMLSGTGPYAYSGAALANAPASSGGGSITLDLTQVIPTSSAAGTVGEALLAARAQGFGKWVKSGTNLTLYAPDGTTPLHVFTLNDALAPTSRA